MITIGITGGSGSGKSYVAKKIAQHGGKWIDADAVYHKLLDESCAMRNAILERFPEANDCGKINRGKLASMVFTNDKALMELNSVTHPFVITEIEKEIAECYRINLELVIIDAIALFESGVANLCDTTVAVIAPEKCRLERIMQRDNLSLDRARARINAQQKEDFYRKKCDYIIENGDDSDIDGEVSQLMRELYADKEE